MKFKVGQKVKIIKSQQTQTIIWVDVFAGQFYRLNDDCLYLESELEAVEETEAED